MYVCAQSVYEEIDLGLVWGVAGIHPPTLFRVVDAVVVLVNKPVLHPSRR